MDTFYNGQLVVVYWGVDESNPQLAHFVDYCYEPKYLFLEPHCRVMTTHTRSIYNVPVSIVVDYALVEGRRTRRVPNYFGR